MRKFFQGWFLAAELMLLGCVGAAYANYDGTQGTGTHFVAFDATHSGTSLCAAANTQCVAFVNINSAGTEVGTATNPFQTGAPSGAFVDGWNATLGAKADAACATSGSTCSLVAINKGILAAAQSGSGATGAAVPGSAVYMGVNVGGNLVGFAPGTAGAASTQVVSIQGIASMTKLLVTPDSVALPANQSVNESQINGVTPLMGNGVSGTGSQRVNIASDNTPFSVNATPQAGTAGGASSFYLQPTASDNHQVIKNGAGTAYSIHISNNSATKNYLRLYDAGTGFNGCNSATGILFGMEVPPTDGGFSVLLGGGVGVNFATGLSICVTSGYGATDTTSATASAMMSTTVYK